MRQPFTLKDIQNTPAGRLESNQHLYEPVKKKRAKRGTKISKEKIWMQFRLQEFGKENNLQLSTEFVFHPERKWRFDWSFNEIKIAFEWEGIISAKSRHTTISGFTGDTTKYNAAQELGWKVYRYTALNRLDLIIDLSNLIKAV